jgi:hypothetical protein
LLPTYDIIVGGEPAIAIASSTDLTHGVVRLNMTGAADRLANHTIFLGGHVLIS